MLTNLLGRFFLCCHGDLSLGELGLTDDSDREFDEWERAQDVEDGDIGLDLAEDDVSDFDGCKRVDCVILLSYLVDVNQGELTSISVHGFLKINIAAFHGQ
jgi:hypothetical protein